MELPELALAAVVEPAELPVPIDVLLALLEPVEPDCEVLDALLALLTVPAVQPSAELPSASVTANRNRPARTFVVDSPIRKV